MNMQKIKFLKKDGLKVNIYDEKKLKKLGMHALLGVGQGSIRGSYLVTMEWNGAKNNSKPLAFVGKEFVLIRWIFFKTSKIYGGHDL